MAKELSNWVQFEATKPITAQELEVLRKRLGTKFQIVSTRWVLTVKADDKARIVRIAYHGGLKYPRLKRLTDQPDRLTQILSPR